MSRSADLAANLAQMVVHCDGIADWHDDRGRFTLARADRPKHIGRGEAEILGGCGPAAGLAPYPGQGVFWPIRASSSNQSSTRVPRGSRR